MFEVRVNSPCPGLEVGETYKVYGVNQDGHGTWFLLYNVYGNKQWEWFNCEFFEPATY